MEDLSFVPSDFAYHTIFTCLSLSNNVRSNRTTFSKAYFNSSMICLPLISLSIAQLWALWRLLISHRMVRTWRSFVKNLCQQLALSFLFPQEHIWQFVAVPADKCPIPNLGHCTECVSRTLCYVHTHCLRSRTCCRSRLQFWHNCRPLSNTLTLFRTFWTSALSSMKNVCFRVSRLTGPASTWHLLQTFIQTGLVLLTIGIHRLIPCWRLLIGSRCACWKIEIWLCRLSNILDLCEVDKITSAGDFHGWNKIALATWLRWF